jgi:hypothetical protein
MTRIAPADERCSWGVDHPTAETGDQCVEVEQEKTYRDRDG